MGEISHLMTSTLTIGQIKQTLDDFDARFRLLAIRQNEASWNMYRGLEHEDLNKLDGEMAAMWREPEIVRLSDIDSPSPELERPLFLLKQGVLRNQVEGIEEIFKLRNECEKMLVEFKPELDGEEISRTDLGEVARWDPDAAKRQRTSAVFISLEKDLHPKVLELINKRNETAKDLGYKSFAHLAFFLNELDLDQTIKQLEYLLENGLDSYNAILDEYRNRPEMTQDGLLSTDLGYLHENYLPNLPNELFPKEKLIDALKVEYKSVGIDLDTLPIETVIQDIPAGGFCFTFDPGKDTRILANPRDGQMWYQILFHEFGHAVQGSTAKGDGKYLVALSDPGFFWEGIAVLFEKLALRDNFLLKYVSDKGDIEEFIKGVKARLAYRIRRLAIAALFEYSLYLEPAPYEDLQKRLMDFTRKYLLVEPASIPPTFTHDIFHITHPCYIQNYVLAEIMAYHLLSAGKSGEEDPWAGGFAESVVSELLVPGGMVKWSEKIEKFTGLPLGPEALLKYLS